MRPFVATAAAILLLAASAPALGALDLPDEWDSMYVTCGPVRIGWAPDIGMYYYGGIGMPIGKDLAFVHLPGDVDRQDGFLGRVVWIDLTRADSFLVGAGEEVDLGERLPVLPVGSISILDQLDAPTFAP